MGDTKQRQKGNKPNKEKQQKQENQENEDLQENSDDYGDGDSIIVDMARESTRGGMVTVVLCFTGLLFALIVTVHKLNKQLEALKQENMEIIEGLEADLSRARTVGELALDENAHKVETLLEDLDKMKAAKSEVELNKKKVELQLEKSNLELEGKVNLIQENEIKLSTLETTSSEQQKKIKELEAVLEEANHKFRNQEKVIEAQQNQMKKLKDNDQNQNKELHDLRAKVAEENVKMENIKKEKEEIENENRNIKSELEKKEVDLKNAVDSEYHHKINLREAVNKLVSVEQEVEFQVDKVSRLKAENEDLETQLSTLRKESEERNEELQVLQKLNGNPPEPGTLESELIVKYNALKATKEELDKTRITIQRQEERINELMNGLPNDEKSVAELKGLIHDKEQEILNMQESLKKSEELRESMGNTDNRIRQAENMAAEFQMKADENFKLAQRIELRAIRAENSLEEQKKLIQELTVKIQQLEENEQDGGR